MGLSPFAYSLAEYRKSFRTILNLSHAGSLVVILSFPRVVVLDSLSFHMPGCLAPLVIAHGRNMLTVVFFISYEDIRSSCETCFLTLQTSALAGFGAQIGG